MASSQQRDILKDLAENLPALAFIAIWQSGSGLLLAGWTGCILAAIVLAGFRLKRIAADPIVLGTNIHILLATPLITGIDAFGFAYLADSLAGNAYAGVFITIFCTGLVLLIAGRSLLRTAPGGSRDRTVSILLLAAIALAGIWAFTYEGPPLLQVAFPIMAIFLARRMIVAGQQDDQGTVVMIAPVVHSFSGEGTT